MNRDINFTLSALVPLLRMNGEKVVSVEAVEDWYEIDGREYMKEVAEITYENGYRQYADIGCDANLTTVYDVIRVIQQMKPKSEKIERIVRDVYPKPDVPDTNVGDTISRQEAIKALDKRFDSIPMEQTTEILSLRRDLRELPPTQPVIVPCNYVKACNEATMDKLTSAVLYLDVLEELKKHGYVLVDMREVTT